MELFAIVYDKTLTEIGWVDGCSSLLRNYRYRNPGSFTMRVPATSETVALMMTGFIITFSDNPKIGYLIESVEPTADVPNIMEVSGRDLRALMGYRVVMSSQTVTGSLRNRIYWLIYYNVTDTNESYRSMKPYMQNLSHVDENHCGTTKTQQFTGDNVLDAIVEMLGTEAYGWRCELDISAKTITPIFMWGTDRTSTVLFDDILGSLDSCEYIRDTTNYCTVARIGGEAKEDGSRVFTGIDLDGGTSGKYTGFDRRELFVDARDLQSTSTDADGSEVTISPEDYTAQLQQRGWEKLREKGIETKITIDTNESVYKFGTDYFVGDIVAYRSHNQIGISGTARVAAAECDEYNVKLTMEILTSEVIV